MGDEEVSPIFGLMLGKKGNFALMLEHLADDRLDLDILLNKFLSPLVPPKRDPLIDPAFADHSFPKGPTTPST